MVCRPFCYKTCTRILRVQPRLQMGQVSIIDNFFPQERSHKLALHCTWFVLCRKKNGCFFQNLHSMFSQFSRVIFDTSFSQDNMENLPNKIGPENFLYFIVSERSGSLWWRNDIFSRTDFSYLFLFFLLCSVFFFFTRIKMVITISNSQVQGFI